MPCVSPRTWTVPFDVTTTFAVPDSTPVPVACFCTQALGWKKFVDSVHESVMLVDRRECQRDDGQSNGGDDDRRDRALVSHSSFLLLVHGANQGCVGAVVETIGQTS